MTEKDRVKKVEEALIAAHVITSYSIHYTKLYEALPEPGWDNRVMARVRSEGTPRDTAQTEQTQRFVWRFAAAACVFALAFSLWALQTGINPEQLALNLFMDDPLALQAVPLFAL